jgi:hypothetical protein
MLQYLSFISRKRQSMKPLSSRRSFFGTAAAAGADALTQTSTVGAQPVSKQPTTDLIRVGAVALGDNSHMNYEIWA